MSRCITVLFCAMAASACVRAEVTLTGRVVDETSAGIAQARVTFHLAGTEAPVFSAVSDPTGAISVVLPGSGSYLARVDRDGYFPLRDFAVEVGNESREVHLTMNHVREVFESVKVSAGTGSVDVDNTSAERKLTNVEIMNVPYTPTRDLRRALKLMPGVLEDTSGSLHFDGAAENQTLYLLDGFNISDPLTGKFNTRLSVESVRTIDWVSGRYSPEFGKGSGGALAIHTDMGDDPLRYSATNFIPGMDTRRGLHLGTWAPRFNISGPIQKGRAWFSEHLDGEYSQPVVPGLPRGQDRTQVFYGSSLTRAQFNVSPSNILFADFLVNYTFAPQTGLGPLQPESTTTDRRARTYFVSLRDQIYLTRGMLLDVGYAEYRNYLRNVPQGRSFYQITAYGSGGNSYLDSTQEARRGQFVSNLFLPAFELGGRHQIKTGIDVDRLNYSQDVRRTGIDVYNVAGELVRETTFGGSGKFSRPGFEKSWYVMDDWKPRPNLVVEAGIRQDWDEFVRQAAFSPRVSVSWAPMGSKDLKISGGYAIVRDATPIALFARPQDQYAIETYFNPDGSIAAGPVATVFRISSTPLKLPRYQNWTLGVERRLPKNIGSTVTYLRKRGQDGLGFITAGPGVFELANLRRDSYDAVEFAVRQHFGEQYEWMASYTRSRAISNAVVDFSVDEPLHVLDNAGPLGWDAPNRFLSWAYLPTWWKNWAVAYSVDARTGFPYSVVTDMGTVAGSVNAQRFPRYFSLNVHPERKFTLFRQHWALRGGFNNITNRRNPTVAQTVPGAPVHFFGSEGRHFVFRVRWLGKAQ